MCTSCGNGGTTPTSIVQEAVNKHTLDQLVRWHQLLLCVKQKGLYGELNKSVVDINSALGIVHSAFSYPENVHLMQPYLKDIQPLIMSIIALNKC